VGTHIHHIVFRHEGTEHGLKVAATCNQDSLVCWDGMPINHEGDVTELLADTVQELLHVLLECCPWEYSKSSVTRLENYFNITFFISTIQTYGFRQP
jgi:hypothetical protein